MKVIVLGVGLVGGPMAIDLAREESFQVTVADISGDALAKLAGQPRVATVRADLRDAGKVKELVREGDLVVNAVPGFMGFAVLRAIIESGKNVVDIAFYPEDPFRLHALAQEKRVIALVDCGIMPGMGSTLAGYASHQLDETDEILIYVGGLPQVRVWPYEYKAVFSPLDVIEEYVRPARYIQNGELVTRPALSDPEFLDFPGVGTLEAFNSDGLRTMVDTMKARNIKEKTLRYPGHIEKMAVLRETGFFSTEEVEINGVRIRPLDLTARLLFPKWKLAEGEADLTVMRVRASGTKDGKPVTMQWDMLDRYDPATNTISMARTTGYTATAAVRMVAAGVFQRVGITPPERLGSEPACVRFLLERLAERGVVFTETRS